MNNNDIHQELKVYESFRYNIEAIFFEPILEADTNTSIDDETNKRNFSQKLMDAVKKLVKQLQSIIERCFLKISNGIARLMQSNDGFDKRCKERMMKVKPLEGVKLIAFQYNDNFLESQVNKLQQVIITKIGKIKTSYTDLRDDESDSLTDKSQGELITEILRTVGAPSDTTDIGSYFLYLKKGFRAEKKEQVFQASMSRQYYQITHSYNKLKSVTDSRQAVLKQQVDVIKSGLENIVHNPRVANEVKRKALSKSKAASHLLNFFTSVLSIYIQLKLEKIISYRSVLKKLYQF